MLKKLLCLFISAVVLMPAPAFAVENSNRLNFFKTNDMKEYGGSLNSALKGRMSENAIIDNNVLSIFIHAPYVYFGTHVGVSRLDLSSLGFVNYSLEKFNMSTAIGGSSAPDAPVWVGRVGGFAKIVGEKMTDVPGSAYENLIVNSSFVDKDGTAWFATNRNLHLFDKEGKWRSYNFDNSQLPVSDFNVFFIDSTGARWIGAGALYSLDPGPYFIQNNWQTYAPADNSFFVVTSIVEDADHYLWFGTNRGIFKRKVGKVGTFEHIATEDKLPSSEVTSMVMGPDGYLWIGTKKGLVSYKGGVFFTYTTTNGLVGNYVNTLTSDGQSIWVGTRDGAARLKDGKWITVTRDGVLDKDFTLTAEQQQLKTQVEQQQKTQLERAERVEQAKIWETRKGIFEDLKNEDTWAAEYVFDLMSRGVFATNEKFYPTRNVTREELVKMAVIASNHPPESVDSTVAPFLDVPENHWSVPYINMALKEGIIEKSKIFGLGQPVNRLEAVKILLKAFNVRLTQKDVSEFEDVSSGDATYVDTAAAKGIISGYESAISARVSVKEVYKFPRFIGPGYTGDDVKNLQKLLKTLGFYPEARDITGSYDGVTTDAVADYQVSRGILRKFTNGKFTEGLGSAGTATRNRLLTETVPTGLTEGVTKRFDPEGSLTRAQMAKIIYFLVHMNDTPVEKQTPESVVPTESTTVTQ